MTEQGGKFSDTIELYLFLDPVNMEAKVYGLASNERRLIMVHVVTMTKHELVALGYGPWTSKDIIRRAKLLMVKKGCLYYKSQKLGRVPVTAVEEVLGLTLNARTLSELAKIGASASEEQSQ
ncbi:hypothetical protein FD03_GL000834 [Companilactobacillus nodensis DSM 19682 = JCM 14932 = NBRC 107160]|uniref:DUF3173 domain-containing protein n=2 Tax=Companilactobacillus nodensis TaxID=460870 RepID=A0A0R1KME0_9LACO|nr:hypothetical protein FD03_GL000834 [Companilactobacillus nodensis DSM 19682 = JCM 14932 = NBRC 107160]